MRAVHVVTLAKWRY